MSIRGNVTLVNTSLIGAGSSALLSWYGGRTACVVQASQYGGACALTFLGPGGAGIPIASSFVANQSFVFDAPPGQYCISNTGSSVALVATLIGI